MSKETVAMAGKARAALYRLTSMAVALSVGHQLDHAIRGNAVGWPLTGEVNAFTVSLGIYPVLAAGLALYRAGRVGPGFWALVSGGGALFVAAVHFGPAAVEPPATILGAYDAPLLGRLACGWLVVFVVVLGATCGYETRLWFRHARVTHAHPDHDGPVAPLGVLGDGGHHLPPAIARWQTA